MDFLENLIIGAILTMMHTMLFLFTMISLVSSNNIGLMGILLFFMLITYGLCWSYGDCILSKLEADYTPFYAANMVGFVFIPCYKGTFEEGSLAGSTIVTVLLVFTLVKILSFLVRKWGEGREKSRVKNERRRRKDKRLENVSFENKYAQIKYH